MPRVSCVSENAFLVSDEEQNICCMAALEQTVYRDVSFAFRQGPRTQEKIRVYLFKLYIFIPVRSTENTLCSDCLGIENLDKELKMNCF